jgi:hypothetical protein
MFFLIVAAAFIPLTFGVTGCNKPATQDNSTQSQPAPVQTDNAQTDQTPNPETDVYRPNIDKLT